MKTSKKQLRRIRNLNDLKRYKRKLRKKIYIRERLLNKHVKDFNKDFSGYYLADETIKYLKLEGTFWQFLPMLFSQGGLRKLLLPIISGIGTGLGSIFIFKNKKSKKQGSTRSSTPRPPYEEDNLFI